jgi:hypothetical protein
MSSERITADVWSELEVMEELKPVAGNTLGGVKALAHQGASLEAGGRPENVKAAGSTQVGVALEAAPEGDTDSVEWESMWDEVINGIGDGRKLNTGDAKRLVQLKEKAVRHAAVWQTHVGKQLASDRCFQQKYLRNTAPWVYTCLEAAELVGGKQEWPPLLEASIRDGTGSFTGEVELTHLQEYFKKTAVPPEQVELMVTQVVKGQSLKFRERRVRFRGKMLPSCKGYEREIAAQNWLDASRGQVVIAGPECLPAMDAGEIMCHPNARVPKNDTATGVATGKGRLIAHLSLFTSTCIYAWERDFPKEIVVYFILVLYLVFSYSKIIKLLGSNKSNYGSDYRALPRPPSNSQQALHPTGKEGRDSELESQDRNLRRERRNQKRKQNHTKCDEIRRIADHYTGASAWSSRGNKRLHSQCRL